MLPKRIGLSSFGTCTNFDTNNSFTMEKTNVETQPSTVNVQNHLKSIQRYGA